jgi:hypothetical protein
LLIALIVFELFSVNMDTNLDPIPPQAQLDMTPPPLIAQVPDTGDAPFRVDGFRGLGDNYGSLYNIMDMRGISPLFLNGPFQLIEPEKINPLAWELFAVRYVFSDWAELPVSSRIIASGEDRFGPVNLHELEDPRPFALLIHDVEIIDSDAFAFELLRHPDFDPRKTVILDREPGIALAGPSSDTASVEVTLFTPERITVHVDTPDNAILSLAQVQYPGWQASLNGNPTSILRAYGALSAIAVPAGEHELELIFDPVSYQIGAVLSLLTWLSLVILSGIGLIRRREK